MDAGQCEFEVDENANPIRVRQGGREIQLDADNQDFCDFLTWASTARPTEARNYREAIRSHYFTDKTRLVEFCKSTGTMLAVKHWPTHPQLVTAGPIRTGGMAFHGLFQCQMARGQSIEPVADGITAGPAPIVCVTDSLLQSVTSDIGNDRSESRKVCSWPIERCFVYLDVSDFSKFPPGQQALVIDTIIRIVLHQPFWTADIFKCFEAMLCIGDGYIFVIQDAVRATRFAANLAHIIETVVAKGSMPVDFHFRMGAHWGSVYSFWDIGRNGWNYAGSGINGGNRVFSAIGKETDDVLFVSDAVRQKIMAVADGTSGYRHLIENMHNRGRRADKHGNLWRVYEVNHTAVAPLPPDLQ